MDIKAEVRHLEEAQKKLDRIASNLGGQPFIDGMHEACLIVEREAKILAPVDTGRLRSSITSVVRVHGNTMEGVVGSAVKYAPFRELGTRPHFVPAQYIETWAKRHGVDFYGVPTAHRARWTEMYGRFTGIFVTGKATPFLMPAFEKNVERIRRLVGDVVAKIVKGK